MTSITFKDYPDFKPNLSPIQMFEMGIMGGSYFRPIHSPKTNKKYAKEYEKISFLDILIYINLQIQYMIKI